MITKEERYAQLVKAVEESKLESRYDVVCYCVGFYGEVNPDLLDLINKLYADGFISK